MTAVLLVFTAPALADTPGFDRPGIAFSTSIVPAGSFAWEQGLPDVVRDSSDGTKTTLYAATTRIRAGLGEHLEMQIDTALFNHLDTSSADTTNSDEGYGDTGLALKVALPSNSSRFSWAALGRVSFATGKAPFTAGQAQYSLGTAAGWNLNDTHVVGFYADFDHGNGQNSYTLSPSFSFPVIDTVAVFLEAGVTYADQSPDDLVAGGGLTWMVTPIVQLDLYADWGLTSSSTDLAMGIGVSAFFK